MSVSNAKTWLHMPASVLCSFSGPISGAASLATRGAEGRGELSQEARRAWLGESQHAQHAALTCPAFQIEHHHRRTMQQQSLLTLVPPSSKQQWPASVTTCSWSAMAASKTLASIPCALHLMQQLRPLSSKCNNCLTCLLPVVARCLRNPWTIQFPSVLVRTRQYRC